MYMQAISLGEDCKKILEKLSINFGNNKSLTVRHALNIFNEFFKSTKNGEELFFRSKDGKETKVLLLEGQSELD